MKVTHHPTLGKIITFTPRDFVEKRWRWSWWRMRWEVQTLAEDYIFAAGDPSQCIEGMEDWSPIRPAVLGPAGQAFECPLHGRFVPAERPRYYPDQPEAKCMAWLPGGLTYCGRYCPPAEVRS